MNEIESTEKVVTTSGTENEIDALVGAIKNTMPVPKAKMDTTPRWFIRHTRAGNHEYQQLCRHVYTKKGARRLQVARVVWPEVKE